MDLAKATTDLQVRVANQAELPIVLAILDEAAQWLISKGIHQWDSPPPPALTQHLTTELEGQRIYLVDTPAAASVATFRLNTQDTTRSMFIR
jgi:hypothetical protein